MLGWLGRGLCAGARGLGVQELWPPPRARLRQSAVGSTSVRERGRGDLQAQRAAAVRCPELRF